MGQVGRTKANLLTGKERGFAIEIAKEAGAIIRADFKLPVKTTQKSDGSPITDTDIRINQMVISAIRKEFPTHDILSEEGSYLSNRSNYRWVSDPLDGTIAFCHKIPTSVFSLALVIKGRPHIGVVYDPFIDRLFFAELQNGAFLNGERIEVSRNCKLDCSVIGISYWKNAQFNLVPVYQKLTSKKVSASILKLGSIAYMGALVSSGEFTANIHAARMPYDSAALKVIVEEAKGKVTDLFGKEQLYNGKIRGCLMSNGILHEELLKFTKLVRK